MEEYKYEDSQEMALRFLDRNITKIEIKVYKFINKKINSSKNKDKLSFDVKVENERQYTVRTLKKLNNEGHIETVFNYRKQQNTYTLTEPFYEFLQDVLNSEEERDD